MRGALPYLHERRKFIVIALREESKGSVTSEGEGGVYFFFSLPPPNGGLNFAMAYNNELRLWKLIVLMKNKSANVLPHTLSSHRWDISSNYIFLINSGFISMAFNLIIIIIIIIFIRITKITRILCNAINYQKNSIYFIKEIFLSSFFFFFFFNNQSYFQTGHFTVSQINYSFTREWCSEKGKNI